MSLDEVIRRATTRAGIVRVSNALNPLLWLSALSPISWLFAFLFRTEPVLTDVFVTLGALPFVAVIIAYFVLLGMDRDRLQSEEFVLRQQELAIIERKLAAPLSFDEDRLAESPEAADEPIDKDRE